MPKAGTGTPLSSRKGSKARTDTKVGEIPAGVSARVSAIMVAAERLGLLEEKRARITGAVNPELVRQAKLRTGITTDTDLIEFALASIALDDNFAEMFRKMMGSVSPEQKLGY